MVKSAVRVCIRTRPTAQFAHSELLIKPDSAAIDVNLKKNPAMGVVNNMRESYIFKFDKILHNSSQDTVYQECVSEITRSVAQGFNGTVLVYGQTGAGKTYTMSGGSGDYKTRGCIPRAIQELFQEIVSRPDQAFTVRISYLEIYNESLFDLLAPGGITADGGDNLLIQEDAAKGSITVKGLTLAVANSEEEAMNLFFEGETNRAIAEHQLNSASSRSHCILTLHVESRSRVESADRVLSSKLNMVDLAGSERVSKTHSTGAILREAMYINKSLSFLEQCVIALTDRGRDHVPFRQSKLTHYLKDSLGGNCKTTMIANIWGEAAQLDETISTLSFATRMMHVRNEAQVNIKMDASLLVKKYEQEIRELKQELAMHDALSGRNRVKYEPYTDEQRYELSQSIQRFLKGEVEELEIVNVRHVKELFTQFKIICNNALDEAAAGRRPNSVMPAGADGAAASGGEVGAGAADGVGQLADKDGFSIGRAADSAKPLQSVKKGGERAPHGGASPVPNRSGASKALGAGLPPPDKKQAFEDFKETDGSAANGRLRDALKTLRDKRKQQQDLVLVINGCKREIDALKEQLDGKREQVVHAAEERGAELVIDDEEFALVRTLKGRKAAYREGFEELKVLKSEVEYLSKLSEQARARLVFDFEAWYRAAYEDGPASAGGPGGATLGGAGASLREEDDGEAMDDSEKFDRLEVEKVMAEDPDSLAYHKAAKNILRKTAPGAKGAGKRVKGEAAPQPVV